jgi:adenosylcobinamide kinase/adenosylcobinamide-phosphate guanylyltransferase
MSLILIGGGSRSGKSNHALALARDAGVRRAFIATAQAHDDEMRERIRNHQADRGADFTTFEEPFDIARVISTCGGEFDVIVVDCLTLWLSNLLCAEGRDVPGECAELVEAAVAATAQVLLVTNEVGCGIVPENALARQFRDYAGRLNQDAARHASAVYWMVFGIALKVK